MTCRVTLSRSLDPTPLRLQLNGHLPGPVADTEGTEEQTHPCGKEHPLRRVRAGGFKDQARAPGKPHLVLELQLDFFLQSQLPLQLRGLGPVLEEPEMGEPHLSPPAMHPLHPASLPRHTGESLAVLYIASPMACRQIRWWPNSWTALVPSLG